MALEQMPVWLEGARARVTEPPLELVLADALEISRAAQV